MSGYEQRLAADKSEIRQRVYSVGKRVQNAIAAATQAMLQRDHLACYRIVLGDLPINREIRALDERCHRFVARHLPSAGHLRFVSSVLQMNVALERIGDYAVTIAREGVQLTTAPPESISSDIEALSEQACETLGEALLAFAERDAELARKTRPRAKAANRSYGQFYRHLTQSGSDLPLADSFALMTVFHRLDRVSDQAKNISEETLFELTGEMKAPRKYRVLFVDNDGSALASLAESIARKTFPESGEYACASVDPRAELLPHAQDVAERLGIDLVSHHVPRLPHDEAELEFYDVIVAVTSGAYPHITDVPYATSVLDWSLPHDAAEDVQRLAAACQDLTAHVHDLMVLLRGDTAC